MQTVEVPSEVREAVTNVTVDDIPLVPDSVADRGWIDTISSVLHRFNNILVNGARGIGLFSAPRSMPN